MKNETYAYNLHWQKTEIQKSDGSVILLQMDLKKN